MLKGGGGGGRGGGGREKVIIIKRKGEGHMVADSFMEQVCFQMSAKRCQGVCFPTYLRSFYTFSVMVVCAAGRICLIALGPAAGGCVCCWEDMLDCSRACCRSE